MKAMKSLLVAALAAGALAATDAQAQSRHGGGGAHFGGGGHWSGGHWRGGHWWGPRVGFFIGAPILWSSWYWGYPYDYYWPRTVIVERSYPGEVAVQPGAATTEVPRGEGAPAQAPAYRNYCESARAYYPKVTKCPEGWRFDPAR
jgi:hypothetical protein